MTKTPKAPAESGRTRYGPPPSEAVVHPERNDEMLHRVALATVAGLEADRKDGSTFANGDGNKRATKLAALFEGLARRLRAIIVQ